VSYARQPNIDGRSIRRISIPFATFPGFCWNRKSGAHIAAKTLDRIDFPVSLTSSTHPTPSCYRTQARTPTRPTSPSHPISETESAHTITCLSLVDSGDVLGAEYCTPSTKLLASGQWLERHILKSFDFWVQPVQEAAYEVAASRTRKIQSLTIFAMRESSQTDFAGTVLKRGLSLANPSRFASRCCEQSLSARP